MLIRWSFVCIIAVVVFLVAFWDWILVTNCLEYPKKVSKTHSNQFGWSNLFSFIRLNAYKMCFRLFLFLFYSNFVCIWFWFDILVEITVNLSRNLNAGPKFVFSHSFSLLFSTEPDNYYYYILHNFVLV